MNSQGGATAPATSGGSTPSSSAPSSSAPANTAITYSPVIASQRHKRLSSTQLFVLDPSGQIVPYVPTATAADQTGGATAAGAATTPQLLVKGALAAIVNGQAAAPTGAPRQVQQAIWAANSLIGKPYLWGGGHQSFNSSGYDCSGSVSYLLHGGNLLSSPLDSSAFMSWGSGGLGRWITVFTDPGHAYVDVAGIRLDTSAADDPGGLAGPRWRPLRTGNGGFTARHPGGF